MLAYLIIASSNARHRFRCFQEEILKIGVGTASQTWHVFRHFQKETGTLVWHFGSDHSDKYQIEGDGNAQMTHRFLHIVSMDCTANLFEKLSDFECHTNPYDNRDQTDYLSSRDAAIYICIWKVSIEPAFAVQMPFGLLRVEFFSHSIQNVSPEYAMSLVTCLYERVLGLVSVLKCGRRLF